MPSETKTAPLQSSIAAREIPTGEIPVYITKSNYFRVIHVDGIYGGGTPTLGNIMMTVFSHRVPFPERIVNGADGTEIQSKRQVKYGVEQEYEASLVMNLETAKSMRIWLDNTIKNAEILMQQINQRNQQK